MTSRPLVSVVMNCLNAEEFLREAIDSVYAQDMDDWEIIFLDNGSTDSSAAIAGIYDDRLHYHRNDQTAPLGAARNQAAAKARGIYVAFLDCDDLWMPCKLRKQIGALTAPPASSRPRALCYTDAMRIDASGRGLAPYSYLRRLSDGNIYLDLIADQFIAMSSSMVERRAFEEVGGFNGKYSFIEEWDLYLRIARRYDVAVVPELLTKIRLHKSNASRDSASQDEKLVLLESLEVASEAEKSARQKAQWEYRLRASLFKLLMGRKHTDPAAARLMLRAITLSIAHPGLLFRLLAKFASPSVLRILWLKLR